LAVKSGTNPEDTIFSPPAADEHAKATAEPSGNPSICAEISFNA
jgi:hypothetical protein